MGQITEDMYASGAWLFKNATLQAGCVTNAMVNAAAAIDTTKLRHRRTATYAQPNTTATTETKGLHVVYGTAGTLIAFRAGSIVACIGGATITVDLKKNGTTVLSAVITLNSSSTAYVVQAGTITSPTVAAGDVLTIVVTATVGGGTLGTGFFCELVIDEDAA